MHDAGRQARTSSQHGSRLPVYVCRRWPEPSPGIGRNDCLAVPPGTAAARAPPQDTRSRCDGGFVATSMITLVWLWMKVSQRGFGPGARLGPARARRGGILGSANGSVYRASHYQRTAPRGPSAQRHPDPLGGVVGPSWSDLARLEQSQPFTENQVLGSHGSAPVRCGLPETNQIQGGRDHGAEAVCDGAVVESGGFRQPQNRLQATFVGVDSSAVIY